MDVEHTRQLVKLAEIHVGGGSHTGKNGLACARGSMNTDSGFHHGIDDGIDLLFGGFFLHRYDHCLFPVSGASDSAWAPVPWPSACAWAFLSDANSFFCKARITSRMRS